MKHCPSPECPHRQRVGAPAEFYDGIERCSDCGTLLQNVSTEPDEAPGAAVQPTPPALWRRLGVTLLAPLVLFVGSRIPLPGIDLGAIEAFDGQPRSILDPGVGGAPLNVLALGIHPILTAYLIVEIAAVVVRSWRPLRHGGFEGRAKLERATAVLAVLLAAFQGYGVVTFVEASGFVARPGLGSTLLILLSLAAGTSCLMLAARWIGRHGLINGFAALTIAAFLQTDLVQLVRRIDPSEPDPLRPLDVATLVVGIAILVGATLIALGVRWDRRARRGSEKASLVLAATEPPEVGLDYRTSPARHQHREASLPIPASGTAPLESAASLLLFVSTLASLGLPVGNAAQALRTDDVYLPVYAALAAGLTVFFAVLFNDPARVASVWARLEPRRGEGAADAGSLERAARHQLRGAVLKTLALLAVVGIVWEVVGARVGWCPSKITILLATAVGADLVAEWRARTIAEQLVSVWPEHRPYALGPARHALATAGIPVHARGEHHRVMLQFAGPWVPVELLVSPDRADEARRVLEALLHPNPAPPDDDDPPPVRRRRRAKR